MPTLDGVAFIDPRRSQVDVVQAVGRAIRKADDKTLGTIVIPVLVDDDDDPERGAGVERVRPRLGGRSCAPRPRRGSRRGTRRASARTRPARHRRGAPGQDRARSPDRRRGRFRSRLRHRVVETATASWEFWFGLLERFVACEGHARVPKNHLEEGWKLGQWAGAQRSHRSRLSEDKRHRLEALPGWVWGLRESSWERAYLALRLFADREGHARPPIRHREVEMRIGQWVNVQRTRFQEGGLPPERVAALEMLPGWVWSANDADWDTGFAALCRFVEREGHARVQDGFVEGEYPLGTWVAKNRANRRDGVLSADRATRLEALPGWSWRPSHDKWETAFDLAKQFSEREGHTAIPHEHTEDGFALGRWLYKQRGSYRLGRLSVQRQARLEALPGFLWDVSDKHWDRAFNLLKAYAAREGHATVPKGHIEAGFGLGGWVNAQRTQFVRGDLHAMRHERLDPSRVGRGACSRTVGSPRMRSSRAMLTGRDRLGFATIMSKVVCGSVHGRGSSERGTRKVRSRNTGSRCWKLSRAGVGRGRARPSGRKASPSLCGTRNARGTHASHRTIARTGSVSGTGCKHSAVRVTGDAGRLTARHG